MEKYAFGKRPQTCQPFIIKMGYLIGTLRWRNNALSVQKYVMAAPKAVSDFKRRCLSLPLFIWFQWLLKSVSHSPIYDFESLSDVVTVIFVLKLLTWLGSCSSWVGNLVVSCSCMIWQVWMKQQCFSLSVGKLFHQYWGQIYRIKFKIGAHRQMCICLQVSLNEQGLLILFMCLILCN